MHNSNPVPTRILTPSLFDPSGGNQGPKRTKKSLLSLASFPCFFSCPAIWFSSSNLPWNQSPRNHKGVLRLLLLRVLLLLFFVKVFFLFSVVFSSCSCSCRDEGRCSAAVRPWTRRAPLACLRLCLRGCRWQLVPRLHGCVSLGPRRSDRLCYPAALRLRCQVARRRTVDCRLVYSLLWLQRRRHENVPSADFIWHLTRGK
jgi:hypothetical protein